MDAKPRINGDPVVCPFPKGGRTVPLSTRRTASPWAHMLGITFRRGCRSACSHSAVAVARLVRMTWCCRDPWTVGAGTFVGSSAVPPGDGPEDKGSPYITGVFTSEGYALPHLEADFNADRIADRALVGVKLSTTASATTSSWCTGPRPDVTRDLALKILGALLLAALAVALVFGTVKGYEHWRDAVRAEGDKRAPRACRRSGTKTAARRRPSASRTTGSLPQKPCAG
jgi:hypothetical protein